VPITYTSGEQVEVYRFNWPITIGVPATALFLQAWLPRHLSFFAMLDLPLLVTIFFGISRRNPVSGLLTGGVIGVFQDALTSLPIGINGIAKTVVGYGASSLGVKLDVENAGARLLVRGGNLGAALVDDPLALGRAQLARIPAAGAGQAVHAGQVAGVGQLPGQADRRVEPGLELVGQRAHSVRPATRISTPKTAPHL